MLISMRRIYFSVSFVQFTKHWFGRKFCVSYWLQALACEHVYFISNDNMMLYSYESLKIVMDWYTYNAVVWLRSDAQSILNILLIIPWFLSQEFCLCLYSDTSQNEIFLNSRNIRKARWGNADFACFASGFQNINIRDTSIPRTVTSSKDELTIWEVDYVVIIFIRWTKHVDYK